jgi:hypothetical protein
VSIASWANLASLRPGYDGRWRVEPVKTEVQAKAGVYRVAIAGLTGAAARCEFHFRYRADNTPPMSR